jgi:hypothetical protein
MIGSDDGVELSTHRPHEHCVRGKWPRYPGCTRSWGKKLDVLISKTSTVAAVRIERTKRNPRRGNAEPLLQPLSCNGRCVHDGFDIQPREYVAQGDVGGREHHPQLVGGEHHCHVSAGESR